MFRREQWKSAYKSAAAFTLKAVSRRNILIQPSLSSVVTSLLVVLNSAHTGRDLVLRNSFSKP